MLITKIFVNMDLIDEIWIHNTGETRKGIFTYKIEKPAGIDDILTHKRSDGYHGLLVQALAAIMHNKATKHGKNKN